MTTNRLNLARKYRPKRLEDVRGQPVAVKTLSEALKKDRIAPAYLFSGPRGTGKTTCARIFARAATCLSKDPANRPCEKCKSCEAHAAGRVMDLIEIDGASHTGVDDVRSIIDAVAFRPSVGAKTVHIIDEVHMLSNAAFNALLKTLEEPPPHALFLFATTEQDKIPATILSRVQRIEMQRLKEGEILQNLQMICKEEKISATDKILDQIAAAADGSLRDAQTLLEQLTLLSGSLELDQAIVDSFLGTIGTEQEIEILELIAAKNISPLLEKAGLFYQQGKDLPRLLNRLVVWARILLLTKSTGSTALVEKECAEEYLKRLTQVFNTWGVEDTDRLFEILWSGHERIKKSELPRITLETTLIRAARIPLTEDLARIIRALESQPVQMAPQITAPSFSPPSSSPARASVKVEPILPTSEVKNTEDLLLEIKKKRPSIFAIVNCAEFKEWKDETLSLRFPKGHFAFRQVSEKILQKELTEMIQQLSSNRCRFLKTEEATVVQKTESSARPTDFMKEAQKTILNDPAVQKAAKFLDAKIESLTISGVRTDTK
ncbi:MAG: polymerase subunit gamma/tau [Bacteriovoracaceae bacterium]|nr:polymerase subunit gamma/tau [Bacteriovoracaceae bacterium]